MPIDTAALAAALTTIFEDIDPAATAEEKAALISDAIDAAHTDGGGGGGAVDSVNGQTGVVELDFADVGADEDGAAAAAQAAAEAYTDTEVAAEATSRASADTALSAAIASEASTRAAADSALSASLASEATTRAADDATNAAAIAAEAAARSSAITTEAAARVAGDALAIQASVLTAEEQLLVYRGGTPAALPAPTAERQVPMRVGGIIVWTALSFALALAGDPCMTPIAQQGSPARTT